MTTPQLSKRARLNPQRRLRRRRLTVSCLSGKVAYKTRIDALIGVMRMVHPQRPYQCPDCGQWHTSSWHPGKGAGSISTTSREHAA